MAAAPPGADLTDVLFRAEADDHAIVLASKGKAFWFEAK